LYSVATNAPPPSGPIVAVLAVGVGVRLGVAVNVRVKVAIAVPVAVQAGVCEAVGVWLSVVVDVIDGIAVGVAVIGNGGVIVGASGVSVGEGVSVSVGACLAVSNLTSNGRSAAEMRPSSFTSTSAVGQAVPANSAVTSAVMSLPFTAPSQLQSPGRARATLGSPDNRSKTRAKSMAGQVPQNLREFRSLRRKRSGEEHLIVRD
jgi:hypothetical protein